LEFIKLLEIFKLDSALKSYLKLEEEFESINLLCSRLVFNFIALTFEADIERERAAWAAELFEQIELFKIGVC
jgi:hypothetical protein